MATALKAPPFGRDTSATDRVRYGRIVSGGVLIAEALYRRLTSERGSLNDDPNYGFPVALLLNADASDDEIAAYPGMVRSELEKDPRVDTLIIRVTQAIDQAGRASLDIDIEGTGKNDETFALSLNVADLKVELLAITGTNG